MSDTIILFSLSEGDLGGSVWYDSALLWSCKQFIKSVSNLSIFRKLSVFGRSLDVASGKESNFVYFKWFFGGFEQNFLTAFHAFFEITKTVT